MSSRGRLLHAWTRQVEAVLPAARVTRVRVLALFAAGIVWANAVTLGQVAAALPLGATDPSTERRLQRFLCHPGVDVATLWEPLLPILLATLGRGPLVLVFDPTPYRDDATILVLGVVVRRRVLPLAWRVMPQQEPWPERLRDVLGPLLAPVAAAIPAGTPVAPAKRPASGSAPDRSSAWPSCPPARGSASRDRPPSSRTPGGATVS